MADKQVLVSIGIPFYNSEKYLAEAIKSVINQTHVNWELILIDDGSTDTSFKIAENYEKSDNRIRVLSDQKNLGLATRLNQLSREAKGKYYARMDSDDIMFPNRIKRQVAYLESHKNVDLVGTGLIAIDNDNNITGIRKGSFGNDFDLPLVLKATWCVHPTITGKSEWFKNNLYDPKMVIAEDYDIWIRTVSKSSFVRLKDPFLFYREASTPTFNKYFKSTRYSLKILLKNRKVIGLYNLFKYTLIRIFKLTVYAVFQLFNSTGKLIERRSVPILEEERNKYKSILNSIIK